MPDKYIIPNLAPYLKQKGMPVTDFIRTARKASNDEKPGNRTWQDAMKSKGAGEVSVNRIIGQCKEALDDLKWKDVPANLLAKSVVKKPPKKKKDAPTSAETSSNAT